MKDELFSMPPSLSPELRYFAYLEGKGITFAQDEDKWGALSFTRWHEGDSKMEAAESAAMECGYLTFDQWRMKNG